MIDKTKVAIRASTQDHLDIENIRDDIVILKDGGACLVLSTTAVNFGLLSEQEQDATIFAYAGLLNSLTFSVQIVIRSQKKDVTEYLQLLDRTAQKERRGLIKNQIVKYRQFVQETVQKNNVLDKKFYLVIPMSALELGISSTLSTTLGKKNKIKKIDQETTLKKAKVNLYPKRDHLLRLLGRLGLQGRQLTTPELIRLYFNIYNQETQSRPMVPGQQYEIPLVQTATAPPEENPPAPNINTVQEKPAAPPEPDLQNQIDNLVKNSA